MALTGMKRAKITTETAIKPRPLTMDSVKRFICYNQFWLTFKGNSFYFIIINKTFFIDTVRYAMEILAGEVR